MSADSAIPASVAEDVIGEAFAKGIGRDDGAAALTPTETAFVSQMREDYVPGDLPGLSLTDLAVNLSDFWRFAERRSQPGPAIQITEAIGDAAGDIDRLDIVQDDSPFLVDSVMAEIAEAGVQVRAMFHGVVDVARDMTGRRRADGPTRRESMIRYGPDHSPSRDPQGRPSRSGGQCGDAGAHGQGGQ